MISFDVFNDIYTLRDMVDRFFDDIPSRTGRREFPYISVYEGNNDIELRALMPGISNDQVDIQLVDTSLVITGEKKDDYADKPYIRKERSFGNFKKSVKLPYRIDAESIEANLKDGILTVKMKKSEDAKPRKIEIH